MIIVASKPNGAVAEKSAQPAPVSAQDTQERAADRKVEQTPVRKDKGPEKATAARKTRKR